MTKWAEFILSLVGDILIDLISGSFWVRAGIEAFPLTEYYENNFINSC